MENQDLWFILSAQTTKHHVVFIKVKGHADHPENNRCDELARAAIDEYRRINTAPEGSEGAADQAAANNTAKSGEKNGTV